MGLPHRQLYATNTGDGEIFLSAWKPEKRNGKYYWPDSTAIGGDIWVNNTINLKEEEGTVPVMVVPSDKPTGIWLVCVNGYFLDEQWLYNYKHRWKPDKSNLDYDWAEKTIVSDDIFGIHIDTDIEMVHGDGPIPVTLVRGEYPVPELPAKKSFWTRLLNIFKK